jgi:hypothetical protein
MGTCAKCGAETEPGFEVCWSCCAPLPATAASEAITDKPAPPAQPESAGGPDLPPGPRVCFTVFRSYTQSWEELFGQAAAFASRIDPNDLISISHSEDDNEGVVTVWYWQR